MQMAKNQIIVFIEFFLKKDCCQCNDQNTHYFSMSNAFVCLYPKLLSSTLFFIYFLTLLARVHTKWNRFYQMWKNANQLKHCCYVPSFLPTVLHVYAVCWTFVCIDVCTYVVCTCNTTYLLYINRLCNIGNGTHCFGHKLRDTFGTGGLNMSECTKKRKCCSIFGVLLRAPFAILEFDKYIESLIPAKYSLFGSANLAEKTSIYPLYVTSLWNEFDQL